ncbi:MAG: ParA family protein [SAR324 cluster bacterium]|nr:ParA family protein [SAR324 cluster bacterium]
MTTIISFVSQKGGVGKTTSATNLASAFAFGGYSVLLIDLDPQSSVRFSVGVKRELDQGTLQLLTEPGTPMQRLIRRTDLENLHFIFSNISTLSAEREAYEATQDPMVLSERISEGAKSYDFVIIDAPASTNNLVLNAIYASDLTILPLQCESLAVKSLKRFLVSFNELQAEVPEKKLRIAGILMTMFDKENEVHRKVSKQIYQALGNSVFKTIIPRNDSITEASALGKSVITHKLNSVGATAYIRLMDELVDKFNLR